MKTKQVIVWTLIIAGMFGLLWFTGKNKVSNENKIENTTTNTNVKNKLTISETFYDFGVISMKNGNVNKIFKVSNLSKEDINLESVTTSCMCTVAYIAGQDGNKKGPFGMPGHGSVPKVNELIKAGEIRNIEVVYDPNAHGPAGVGLIERSVFLEDENNNVMEFKFKVNVTP